MQEIWRDIKGYEGLYQVSNLGNVKRLKGKWVKKERLIKQRTTSTYDYYSVHLSNHQKKRNVFVHRLVAQAFVKNPKNKPIINHIDGNKLNNKAENLEWCTYKENSKKAYELGLNKPARELGRTRKVGQYDLDNNLIKIWDCFFDINKELGFYTQNIWKCCNGWRNKAHGFIWKYEDVRKEN